MGPVAPTGPLRLVLPGSSGDAGTGQVVQVSASSADAGQVPAVVLRLHTTGDAVSAPNLPTGAFLQFNVAALGGVRAPDQFTFLTGPLRLTLPQPDGVNSDVLPWLAQITPIFGAEEAVERLIIGGGWEGAARPSGQGPTFPWLLWPISPLIWGWITSPLVPNVPTAGDEVEGPVEAETAAPAQPTAAADDRYGVDASWAGALLAAGLLSVPKADQERKRPPLRATSRRDGTPDR
jgi:hypothetical protein